MEITRPYLNEIDLFTLLSSRPTAVFEFNGHLYIQLIKGTTQKTHFSVDQGFAPCINLKSHTIRGIPTDATVKEVKATITIE